MKLSRIPLRTVERCQGKTEARSIATPVALEKWKKPVGDQPFATAAQIRRIDPRWVMGPVPYRFWHDEDNRRNFLVWAGWKLGLRRMRDWYGLRIEDVKKQHGGGAMSYWHGSLLNAVRDCFPEYDWLEWLFSSVAPGFWEEPANRRRFCRWLGIQKGYRRATDWYSISHEDINAYGGSGLLARCSSMHELLREYLPELDWDQFAVAPTLSVEEILSLADEYHATHGKWPYAQSQKIDGMALTWKAIDARLRRGHGGLPEGSSLLQILKQYRQARTRGGPLLTEQQILAWADAHFTEHGRWPKETSGRIAGTNETWGSVVSALRSGGRGLPKSSLFQLLAEHRGAPRTPSPPALTDQAILGWADAYFAKHGRWPKETSGRIAGTKETWCRVFNALRKGCRGLAKSSLSRLLAEHRDVPRMPGSPALTEEAILAWADAYFAEHGRWPKQGSGRIAGTKETWHNVDHALWGGFRGLPKSSLARLLKEYRGVRYRGDLPKLKEKDIVEWAKAHFEATGRQPSSHAGVVHAAPPETWSAVDNALRAGTRGLPGNSSLAQLLKKHGLK